MISRLCHLASSLGDVLAKWTQSVVVPNVVHPKIGDIRHLAQLKLGGIRGVCEEDNVCIMAESSNMAQGQVTTHASNELHHDETHLNPKAFDILLKYLEQTLKNVNNNVVFAFVIVAFLLIPGLEGAFSVETREGVVVVIPVINLKAGLLTAALFGLVMYWVFCLRAVSQVSHARNILYSLRFADIDVLDAALQFPSIATASLREKRITCISLAILGVVVYFLIYISPLGWEGAALGSLIMAVPPLILLYQISKPLRAADIESLLVACGAEISEGRGSRVRIALHGVRAVFHRPHPRKETDKGAVVAMRRFLTEAGVEP